MLRSRARRVALLTLCLLFCCLAPCVSAENLVQNGGFEAWQNGLPTGWTKGMWFTEEGISYLEEAGEAHAGEACILVENVSLNDARFEQVLRVKAQTTYRFAGKVRAQDCDPTRKGANLSVADIYDTSPDVHDTDGAWVDIEFYGRTGKGQKEITLMARLGGYGSENTGMAWFDEIVVEEVDKVPDGAQVMSLLAPPPAREPAAPGTPGLGTVLGLWAIALVFAALCVPLCRAV